MEVIPPNSIDKEHQKCQITKNKIVTKKEKQKRKSKEKVKLRKEKERRKEEEIIELITALTSVCFCVTLLRFFITNKIFSLLSMCLLLLSCIRPCY